MQSRSKVQSKARNSRTTTPLTFACRRYTSKQTANKNVWTRAASKKTQVSTHWSCLSGPLHQQYHEINCLNNVLVSLVAKGNSRETALLVKIQSKCSLTVTSVKKLRIHMRVRFFVRVLFILRSPTFLSLHNTMWYRALLAFVTLSSTRPGLALFSRQINRSYFLFL